MLHHNVAFTGLSKIAPFGRLWIIGQPRNIMLRNTRTTIVLGGSQFTRCIPLSKSGRIFCVRQVYFTSKSWRRIWWRVNQPFKHTFSHHVAGKQYYEALFIIIQTSDRILQDKLHLFNILDNQSTRFLCTTNYSIDQIIKRSHKENFIMPGLFS